MNYKITRLIVCVFCTLLCVSANASNEINYLRLFKNNVVAPPIKNLGLVAYYSSDEKQFFLLETKHNGELFLLNILETFQFADQAFTLLKFEHDLLYIENEQKQRYSVAFNTRAKKEVPMTLNVSVSPKKKQSAFDFADNEKAIVVFWGIAESIGIPKVIYSQFTTMPSQGRSRTGRPGWLLDDKIPSLLLVNSPFEQNDIILSINGIPANDLENLQLHLLNRNTRDVFEVEIQRDKRLKMIRMKL